MVVSCMSWGSRFRTGRVKANACEVHAVIVLTLNKSKGKTSGARRGLEQNSYIFDYNHNNLPNRTKMLPSVLLTVIPCLRGLFGLPIKITTVEALNFNKNDCWLTVRSMAFWSLLAAKPRLAKIIEYPCITRIYPACKHGVCTGISDRLSSSNSSVGHPVQIVTRRLSIT